MYSHMTDEQIDEAYTWRSGNWYDKVNAKEGWCKCKTCGVLPRTWRFDNGLFARCLCYTMYDTCPARSESIMSVYKRTGLTAEYKPDNLRLAWNVFALTGEEQNKLDEGMW